MHIHSYFFLCKFFVAPSDPLFMGGVGGVEAPFELRLIGHKLFHNLVWMQDIYFQLRRPMGGEVKISKQIKKEMAQPAALLFWLG